MTTEEIASIKKFEESIKEGDKLLVRWTHNTKPLEAEATVVRLNAGTVRIKMINRTEHQGKVWDKGDEFLVPRCGNKPKWSANNRVLPLKEQPQVAVKPPPPVEDSPKPNPPKTDGTDDVIGLPLTAVIEQLKKSEKAVIVHFSIAHQLSELPPPANRAIGTLIMDADVSNLFHNRYAVGEPYERVISGHSLQSLYELGILELSHIENPETHCEKYLVTEKGINIGLMLYAMSISDGITHKVSLKQGGTHTTHLLQLNKLIHLKYYRALPNWALAWIKDASIDDHLVCTSGDMELEIVCY